MTTRTFDAISDPGHGWLKVPCKLLCELDITRNITPYSYVKGEYAYLEEDCDLSTFINAMKAQRPDVQIKQRHRIADKSSRVRNYPSYTSEYAENWRAKT